MVYACTTSRPIPGQHLRESRDGSDNCSEGQRRDQARRVNFQPEEEKEYRSEQVSQRPDEAVRSLGN